LAKANGNNAVETPPELIEIGLMEKFHWTPMEIDQIPFGKLQRLFVTMEQRELSMNAAAEIEAQKTSRNKKTINGPQTSVIKKGARK
jgi:hypothetical protein